MAMHKGHFAFCAVGLVAALGVLALTGGSAGGVGLIVAALVCPLAMVLAMGILVGRDRPSETRSERDDSTPVTEPR